LANAACTPASDASKAQQAVSSDPTPQNGCGGQVVPPQARLTPAEIAALPSTGAPGGVQTTVLYGDPTKPGLYTAMLAIPANFSLLPHTHGDSRTTTVISGTWYFAYGVYFDPALFKPLPAGSLYSEPRRVAHFGQTKAEPVVLYVTGCGPSDTKPARPPG
jgi:hypothetical protein